MIALGLMPRTVQLCTHCQQNPAGFWVSRNSGQTVRRPWCLACLQELDRGSCDVIPFDSAPRPGARSSPRTQPPTSSHTAARTRLVASHPISAPQDAGGAPPGPAHQEVILNRIGRLCRSLAGRPRTGFSATAANDKVTIGGTATATPRWLPRSLLMWKRP